MSSAALAVPDPALLGRNTTFTVDPKLGEPCRMAFMDRVPWMERRKAEVVYLAGMPPADIFNARWVHIASSGVDHLFGTWLWNRDDIILTTSRGIHAAPVAEHVFAMILAMERGIFTFCHAQIHKTWMTRSDFVSNFAEMQSLHMGIIGSGRTGRRIAEIADGFRMIREFWRPGDPLSRLNDFDIVVSTLPLTPNTFGVFDDEFFGAMNSDALFVNVGRGKTVHEGALIRALHTGLIGGAALDVVADEPLSPKSPLWSMPNVFITPHVAGWSENVRQRGHDLFRVQCYAYVSGMPLDNVVDRQEGY